MAGTLDYMVFFGGDSAVGVESIGSYLLTNATGVVVDESGQAFITGYTTASDFPSPEFPPSRVRFQDKNGAQSVEVPEGQTVETDAFDAFVVKLGGTGSLDYATYLGGRLNDFGNDIALLEDGRVVVVGSTASDDFPGFESGLQGGEDGFIAVLDLDSSQVPFSTSVGSAGRDSINGVAVGRDGHVYVAGATTSGFLPSTFLVRGQPESEPFQPLHAGPGSILEGAEYGSDGFVVRLELDGDTALYHYATFLGGSGDDVIWDIDVDASGSAFVTGETKSADFPVKDAVPGDRGRFTDAFVSKLSPFGNDLSYSTVLGGSSTDVGGGIAVDPSGSALVTGWTSNIVCSDPFSLGISLDPEGCPSDLYRQEPADFPTRNAFQEAFQGGAAPILGAHPKDAFVAKFSESSFLSGVSRDLNATIPFRERVAVFYTPRLDAEAGDFVATIDWGDGSPLDNAAEISRIDDHSWNVVGTHNYLEPGAFPILVRVLDITQLASDADDGVNLLDPAINVNVSRREGQQAEPTIAVDPSNTGRVFVAGVDESGRQRALDGEGGGIFAAYSADYGRTWTSRLMADGNDDLPPAAGDPVATFDQFGNLFLTYLGADLNNVVLALSTDGGKTFNVLSETSSGSPGRIDGEPTLDQPTVTTGPSTVGNGSVWVAFQNRNAHTIGVFGMRVDGLGAENIGLSVSQQVPGSGRAADIEVGPDGQVIVIWEAPPVDGVREIFSYVDQDGLGDIYGLFPVPTLVASSHVGANGTLPAIPGGKTAVEANVAWDRSGGANQGRIYVVYAEVAALGCENNAAPLPAGADYSHTNICITSSQDNGRTWDSPRLVNQESTASRFFPSIAVNQTQGVLAVGWYDTSEDQVNSVKTRFHIAASNDGGQTFRSGAPASLGSSNAADAGLNVFGAAFNYGDYSSLDFTPGTQAVYAAWADNSQSLRGNPDRPQFEISMAAMGIMNVRLPRPKIRPLPILGIEGTAIHAPVATFTHPDSSRRASDFTALIDWGDGNVLPGTVSSSGTVFTVSGSHTYANEGAHIVWVTVHDRITKLDSVAVNNISESLAHEADGVIVVDPTNPDRVFAASVSASAFGKSVLTSYSEDGGVTWNTSQVGDSDGLPAACCYPAAAFDQFGHLYFFYLSQDETGIRITGSKDGGKTFPGVDLLAGTYYTSVATGPGTDASPGSVWSVFERDGTGNTSRIYVTGAPVYQKDVIGSITDHYLTLEEDDGVSRLFPSIAVGPQGQVLATYTSYQGEDAPAAIYAHLDPDGLGPMPFGPAIQVVEKQSRDATAASNLAWDRNRGEFGRLYMTFSDRPLGQVSDTDIFLIYSDDAGQTWTGGYLFSIAADQASLLDKGALSDDLREAFLDHGVALSQAASVAPVMDELKLWRIIDGDSRFLVRYDPEQDRLDIERERLLVNPAAELALQFNPSIAVDRLTGNVAVGWYSTIGDVSSRTTVYRLAVSSDGGRIFSDPLTVSPGRSDLRSPE